MGEKERFGKLTEVKPPPLRKNRCENCAFFAHAIPGKLPTTCRKLPPTMLMGNGGMAGVFVPTESMYWCAAWELVPPDAYVCEAN